MKLFNIRKVMVLVSVSIHEARISCTFFGGLKASLLSSTDSYKSSSACYKILSHMMSLTGNHNYLFTIYIR